MKYVLLVSDYTLAATATAVFIICISLMLLAEQVWK